MQFQVHSEYYAFNLNENYFLGGHHGGHGGGKDHFKSLFDLINIPY